MSQAGSPTLFCPTKPLVARYREELSVRPLRQRDVIVPPSGERLDLAYIHTVSIRYPAVRPLRTVAVGKTQSKVAGIRTA